MRPSEHPFSKCVPVVASLNIDSAYVDTLPFDLAEQLSPDPSVDMDTWNLT